MHPAVHVALHGQEGPNVGVAETRPVVAPKHDVGVVSPQVQRLLDVLAASQGIPGLRAADGVEVVQRVRAVLGHAQQPLVGEVEVHLGRCLGIWCHLEDDPDAAERQLLAGLGDGVGRREQVRSGKAHRRAQAAVDVSKGTGTQQGAELVRGPPTHDRPRDHELADHFFEKSVGCHDSHISVRHCLVARHAEHAAEVVDMRMRVDDRSDGASAQRPVGQIEGGGSRRRVRQRIDDEPAVRAGHEVTRPSSS